MLPKKGVSMNLQRPAKTLLDVKVLGLRTWSSKSEQLECETLDHPARPLVPLCSLILGIRKILPLLSLKTNAAAGERG